MIAVLSVLLTLVPSSTVLTVLTEPSLPAALLAVALAALCLDRRCAGIVLARGAGVTAPHAAQEDQPLLRGRVTDPDHHPVRPRAPGTA